MTPDPNDIVRLNDTLPGGAVSPGSDAVSEAAPARPLPPHLADGLDDAERAITGAQTSVDTVLEAQFRQSEDALSALRADVNASIAALAGSVDNALRNVYPPVNRAIDKLTDDSVRAM